MFLSIKMHDSFKRHQPFNIAVSCVCTSLDTRLRSYFNSTLDGSDSRNPVPSPLPGRQGQSCLDIAGVKRNIPYISCRESNSDRQIVAIS
jgi:hypothetical protein